MIVFHELKIGTSLGSQSSGGGVASGFTALHSESDAGITPHYACVRPCPRCLRKSATGQPASEPASLQTLIPRIAELSADGVSVMMRGFEPFWHPELVDIVQALDASNVRRVGMRTDAAALANLRDAQGCIGNGVRVFEIPFLPPEMDALSQAPPMEASIRGVQGIRSAAAALGVSVFMSADIAVCTHTAPYFMGTVQEALVAGVDAIRITCDKSASVTQLLGGAALLDSAHSLAIQNSTAFFGDGCESYLKGAVLYEIVAQQGESCD